MAWNSGQRGRVLALGTATVCVLGLTACGSGSSGSSGESGASAGALNVVAVTNVYGDIAAQVGGDAVEVTSVISSATQDPHSFEADTRTQLAVSKADLVIENGGHYDDFMDQLLETAGSKATVINAVEVSGLDGDAESAGSTESADDHADEEEHAHEHGEFNEHVWYDLESMQKVADRIAADLGQALPDQAATFTANAKAFNAELDAVIQLEDDAKAEYEGQGVAITEPVPLYLLEHLGLENKTPEAFSEAVEEGNDIPIKVLDQTLKIFSGGEVKVFVYNEQTSSTETEKLLARAKADGVPTVGVTETLPEGQDYVGWMKANVEAVTSALG
ncbi:metal ABC transporter solute-binding protein, Zn/Mn family [Kineosporia succinea]|uniref:Zinc/manganese transport system substrate-binding protein n=1 Tax=Kineosporia succinea TaxID=84632 RepID=A0ABT9P0D7_9ACTN|nr:zinc ABC transporter substrate-binding protein [Kineosporia succinea]MDP9826135.1 zinc/manganese transport system substrate-binding protein [Kineosporia succinea]